MKRMLISLGVISVMALSSYRPEAELAPVYPKAGLREGATTGEIAAPINLPYKLIKHGNRTLSYDLSGQLTAVSGPGRYNTTYQYGVKEGFTEIWTKVYQSAQFEQNVVYYVDPKGRVAGTWVSTSTYPANGLGFKKETTEVYQFIFSQTEPDKLVQISLTRTVNNQVTKESWIVYDYVNKTDINQVTKESWIVYDYVNKTDINLMLHYTGEGDLLDVTDFEYTSSANPTKLLPDKNHLNSTFQPFLNPYLHYYPYLNTHLVTKVIVTNGKGKTTAHTNYTYTLHADGTIKQLDRFDGLTGKLLDSAGFAYGL